MAGYIEKIKAAGGETWTIKDPEAPRKNELVDLVYPVGSIYMSVNAVDPGTILGGTWEQIKDRFLLSAGDTYEGGATGGEATHVLSVEEMPSHKHYVITDRPEQNGLCSSGTATSGTDGSNWSFVDTGCDASSNASGNFIAGPVGGSQPHNNMPPYIQISAWRRTA